MRLLFLSGQDQDESTRLDAHEKAGMFCLREGFSRKNRRKACTLFTGLFYSSWGRSTNNSIFLPVEMAEYEQDSFADL